MKEKSRENEAKVEVTEENGKSRERKIIYTADHKVLQIGNTVLSFIQR
jgi:hypothetical protein